MDIRFHSLKGCASNQAETLERYDLFINVCMLTEYIYGALSSKQKSD